MDDYSMRRSGSFGHEVLLDGQVIAWTVDGWWAAIIVGLLDGRDRPLSAVRPMTRPVGETRPPDRR